MRQLLAVLLVALSFGGCAPQPAAPTVTMAAIVLSADAPVSLDRPNQELVAAWPGTRLDPEDVLVPSGSVTVLCPGPELVVVAIRKRPCPDAPGRLRSGSMEFDMISRGALPPVNAPYLLAPRASLLLDPRPALEWNDPSGGPYDVELRAGADLIWLALGVPGPRMDYPAAERELQPGRLYTLLVTDTQTGMRSDDSPALATDVRLASVALRTATANIRVALADELAELDPVLLDLAIAMLYLELEEDGLRLYTEAEVLLNRAAAPLDSPPVWNSLGDARLQTSLPREAADAFERGLASARRLADPIGQADALVGRWRALGAQSDFDEAVALYNANGVPLQAQALREELAGVVTTPTP